MAVERAAETPWPAADGPLAGRRANHAAIEGTQVRGAEHAAVLIPVPQDVSRAAVPHNVPCCMSGYALGALAPEHDAPVGVRDVNAGVDAVEYLAEAPRVDLVDVLHVALRAAPGPVNVA